VTRPVLVLGCALVLASSGAAAPTPGVISFWSDRGGFPGVWTMRTDGTGARKISGSIWAKRGSWSPDGRRIVFDGPTHLGQHDIGQDFDVYVANADGSGRRRITRGPERDILAQWSPDGRWIAFTRQVVRRGPESIWLVRPDGTGLRRLTSGAGPVWAPDSDGLAFARLHGARYAVFTLRLDGTGLRRLTGATTDDLPTDWSSRGLLFSRWQLGQPAGDVWLLDPATTKERRVTRAPSDDFDATWSPDGSRILFTSDRAGSKDVWVMTADGSGARALTRGPAEDWATDWQPPVR
jgi:Tol biopolymer transport system component